MSSRPSSCFGLGLLWLLMAVGPLGADEKTEQITQSPAKNTPGRF